VGGFISRNMTLPDDRISIAVFTNQDDPVAGTMAQDIEQILIAPPADPQAAASLQTAFETATRGLRMRGPRLPSALVRRRGLTRSAGCSQRMSPRMQSCCGASGGRLA
jgi:hypothetical protein